jgi:hypothetical protein
MTLNKIISGGQTGADRAALDFAIAHRIPHGGWCPKGRWAEDGVIDARYQLEETPMAETAQRTEWNVRDSDATVIFSIASELEGGSKLTSQFAIKLGKPWLHLSQQSKAGDFAKMLEKLLKEHHVEILNIAGTRASEESQVYAFTHEVLEALL